MKYFIPVLIVVSLLVSSCSTQNTIDSDSVKLKYNVTAGEGGGVTGLHSGVYIDTSGTAFSFEGKSFITSKKDSLGTIASSRAEVLNSLLEGLAKETIRETGNIYKYIILQDSRTEIRLSWTPASADAQKFDSSFNYVINTAKSLTK